jgi:hypothetical protein
MAKFFDALDDKLIAFIGKQPMFFIASAAAEGRVNLSPKGLDTFRVLSPTRCAYLDFTGSGNETAAHMKAGGRATIMFCSFTRNPQILRLFGRAAIAPPGSALWREVRPMFGEFPGVRQIVGFDISSAQTSCGYGVPLMTIEKERATMTDYWVAQGEDGAEDYRQRKNRVSIDGLPTGWGESAA